MDRYNSKFNRIIRGVSSRGVKGAYAPEESIKRGGGMPSPLKSSPVEIQNSMFLPLMKKALISAPTLNP